MTDQPSGTLYTAVTKYWPRIAFRGDPVEPYLAPTQSATPKPPGIEVTSMSDEPDPRLTFAAYLGTLLLAVVEGDDYWLPLGLVRLCFG